MAETAVYWFTQDLRVADNALLHAAASSESLLCITVVDPVWFQHRMWQRPAMIALRWRFLRESLTDLDRSLRQYGQKLHILYGSSSWVLASLLHDHGINRLFLSHHAGIYEQRILADLQKRRPQLSVSQADQYTLFDSAQLPFALSEVPDRYSGFRKRVETLTVPTPLDAPEKLPPMPAITLPSARPDWVPAHATGAAMFKGGESQARVHLHEYFGGVAPSRYKEVRNELAGWYNSSKFSPWLNLGCVSPRQIKQALEHYEQKHGANESTHWLYVELLWREYFQWLACRVGNKLFAFGGEQGKAPLTSFYPERFRKWCEGETPYPLINACMKELKATGYLSNRGRQIAASCLVNELAVDWRYGAAWFEHCLLDYDVAVNWGNWQYIAGVGADPRGGRHFNLEKQAQQYDPDRLYQKRWKAEARPTLDSRDAADWPILPE